MQRIWVHWHIQTVAACLVLAASAAAQPSDAASPRPYVIIAPDNLEASLQEKLSRYGNQEFVANNFETLFKQLQKSDFFKNDDFFKALKLNEKGSQIEQLKRYQQIAKEYQSNPKFREEVKKLAPQLDNKNFGKGIQKAIEAQQKAATPPTADNQPLPQMQPPPQTVNPSQFEEFLESLKNLKGVGRVFRDSPALQQFVSDMAVKALQNQGGNHPFQIGDLSGGIDKAGDFFSRSLSVFRGGLANVRDLSLPSLPSPPRLPLGDLLSNVPRLGAPRLGGGLGLGHALLWGGLIVISIMILWQLKTRVGPGAKAGRAGTNWRLGPWPVAPSQVATRAELIQAFEYLALLMLGVTARSWNHLDIAVALGARARGGPAEQLAAHRLAALYEEARYAPEDEPLTGAELAEARHNLCYLAGVAAA